ncbi:MAG: histidine phosphatase family protein [Deltaproteobacteria bacterium]|nr:histidine phosphatase family protein [Deltaproteobacteria bacterium]
MNVLLVRHGETNWNREGRYQGRTDIPLSADGEAQVRALGLRLAHIPIARAISSPLSRARRTAEAILTGRTTPLELDEGLLEISHGEWEGQLASDLELSHAEMFGTWRTNPDRHVPAGPGAETLGDVEDRAWPVLLGLPLSRVWMFRQAPATLNVLSGPSIAELQLVRLNDSEHASPLLSEALHRAI